MENKHKLNDVIDYSRDFGFDYFAFKTLERAYLIKINGKIERENSTYDYACFDWIT